MSYLINEGNGVLETLNDNLSEMKGKVYHLETMVMELLQFKEKMISNLDESFIKGHLDYLEEMLK